MGLHRRGTYGGGEELRLCLVVTGADAEHLSLSTKWQCASSSCPLQIPYGPSKSFIDSFSLAAAEQLKPFGVRMNVILPGGRVNLRDASRLGGRPYDIMVPLTLYLASDASQHVTGQILIAEEFNRL